MKNSKHEKQTIQINLKNTNKSKTSYIKIFQGKKEKKPHKYIDISSPFIKWSKVLNRDDATISVAYLVLLVFKQMLIFNCRTIL